MSTTSNTKPRIEITVRVPGPWLGPDDFDSRLPEGYRLGGDEKETWLALPDGSRAEFNALPADDEFAAVFAGGCKREPSDEDKRGVEGYRFNGCLTFPGGTLETARRAIRHTVALLDAGGHGVFVDNSGIAHGSNDWRDLAGDEDPDGGGVFWAYVTTIGSKWDVYTIGMQVMGRRDAIGPRTGDDRADEFLLRNFLAYSYRSGAVIKHGDRCGGPSGPAMRVELVEDDIVPRGSPMHNPFGRYRLVPQTLS